MPASLPARPPCRAPLAAALALSAVSLAHGAPPTDDLHSLLQPVRDKFHAPALAGAVFRDGNLVAVGVCGVRSADAPDPALIDDRFPIGSCSKPMARFVLARLSERGKIDFDAPLPALLPGITMRDEYRPATLAQLLAHTAGIQPYTRIGPRVTPFIFELQGTPQEQRAAFAAHVLSEDPVGIPGKKFVYSNAGFCLVAVGAERATGKPWETLVRDEVFVPLDLKSATVGADPDPAAPRGHEKTPGGFRVQARQFPRLAVMVPAGGVALNIADFARFAGAQADLESGRPVAGLTEKTLKRLPQLRAADAPGAGGTFFGGDGFYTAAFAAWPQERLAIAVASNAGDSDDLCQAAIDAIQGTYAKGLAKEAAESKPQGPRYGFAIQAEDDGGWTVQSVEPGSIADKAGLKAGDRITGINDTKLADLDPDQRMEKIRAASVRLTVEREGTRREIAMERAGK